MLAPGDPGTVAATLRSRPARALAAPLETLDRLFDRAYTSPFNPLYRTGTMAALLLGVALASGVYLLIVYDIARPYESVLALQRDRLVGRWMRALHRYASDGAAVAVGLHVLRLLVQGKTWGPRALAWVTGVLLAAMMLLSAVTGFVLVWDRFGQALAVAGARMLRDVPLFPEPPDRAFAGDSPMPAQFFFMNLFLHVAVPLGMVAFLWLHTARLARAAWFPERRVAVGVVIALVALAVVWPAPLPAPADLLALPGRVPSDWFYAFWLPFAAAAPATSLAVAGALAALLLGVPWLLRPSRRDRPAPAFSDPDVCEGCRQCFDDCPYDAIEMVTGKHPEAHPLRAEVQADRCVSCGLCAASCASLAIGPPGRTARDQLAVARHLVAGHADATRRTVVIACRNNAGLAARLRRALTGDRAVAWFPVDCAGTLHPGTVSYLGGHFGGTLIVACPPQNCVHRHGAGLADARILGERRPAVPGRIATLPVRLVHASVTEWKHVIAAVDGLTRDTGSAPRWLHRVARRAVVIGFSAGVLALVAAGSRWPQGVDADHAVLRLGWRLTGHVRERCRDLTAEEQAARPVHMRRSRECVGEALAYDLTVALDGQVIARKRIRPAGLRGDRPLNVEEEFEVRPGTHAVVVTFRAEAGAERGAALAFDGSVRFERGRVALITYDGVRLLKRS
jgi:ferredoxin